MVVHLAAEYGHVARTGGLAEAVEGLARAQTRAGWSTAVLIPLYGQVREHCLIEPAGVDAAFAVGSLEGQARLWRIGPGDGPALFGVDVAGFDRPGIYGEGGGDYPDNADRFARFVAGALAALPHLAPGALVVHVHDWHTALAPTLLRIGANAGGFGQRTVTVLSAHNAAYQGRVCRDSFERLGLADRLSGLQRDWDGRFSLLELGITDADVVTTVSATHARELCTPLGGFGLHERFASLGDRLIGLTNGIDCDRWDPAVDRILAAAFHPDGLGGRALCRRELLADYGLDATSPGPVAAMVARLVEQKGFDLVMDGTLERFPDLRLIVLGRGAPDFERRLSDLERRFPDRVRVPLAFTDERERQLLAGVDLLIVPSLFEPCGLVQMHAQRYGAVPVARRVGGLAETIDDGHTGFLFDEYSASALQDALARALDVRHDRPRWEAMMRAGMRRDFSWDRTAAAYQKVYEAALRRRDIPVSRGWSATAERRRVPVQRRRGRRPRVGDRVPVAAHDAH